MNVRTQFPARLETDHSEARADLAAAFRLDRPPRNARSGRQSFQPCARPGGHPLSDEPEPDAFQPIRASDLLELDANDPDTLTGPDAPDPTAWDCTRPCIAVVRTPVRHACSSGFRDRAGEPERQQAAADRPEYGHLLQPDDRREDFAGLAFEAGRRTLRRPARRPEGQVMVMGNHGLLVIGAAWPTPSTGFTISSAPPRSTSAPCRPADPLRVMPAGVAERTAAEIERYPAQAERHFRRNKGHPR